MLPEGLFLLAFVIAIISLSAHEATKNGDVTLGGGNVTAGRVELYNNGQWGTVCDDNWDIDDARVVCRQLGFRDAISAHGNALFGAGGGPIHISNVNCLGYESSLIECYFSLSGNCEHGDDAGVTCLPFDHGFVRLLDGNDTNGRVEIFMNGQWGTVCDDTWDILDATVVCRQLGFKGAISAPTEAAFGQGVGPIFLDTVECLGDELTILDCKYKQKSNCQHSEDAGVECFNVDFDEGSVRLAGGNHLAGRVEIYIDNQWGTVCDDDWDELDATVVCRQLGFNDVSSAPRKAAFSEGVGPIHLDSVKCSGEEASLLECEYKVRADCTHAEDASVICQEVNYARISWISVTMVTTILIGIAVIFAGIKMGVLRKISTNIVLWPIWNLCPREGPAVDDLSLPSRPSTQPEIDYRGTSDKRTGTSEPVPLDCCEKLDGSQKDEEPNIKTESTLYTTIPAELILPTQCEESYEIPRNDVKLMETAENDIEAY